MGRSFLKLIEILEVNSLLSNPPNLESPSMEVPSPAAAAATATVRDPNALEPRGRSTHRLGVDGCVSHITRGERTWYYRALLYSDGQALQIHHSFTPSDRFLVDGVDFLRPKVEPAPTPLPQPPPETTSQPFAASELDPAEKATILEMRANVAEVRKAVHALVADDFFREVLVEEVARGIDAVNRTTLSRFMLLLGMQRLRIPLPVPGAGSLLSLVPLAPKISTEDRYAMENGKALLLFIVNRVNNQGGKPVPVQMVRLLPLRIAHITHTVQR